MEEGNLPDVKGKTRKVTDRKCQIADAAIRLFLKRGVSGTSMRDIADAVGVTTGSIYYHFRSKDESINLILERGPRSVELLREYRRSLGDVSPTEALRECAEYWLGHGDKARRYSIFYARESLAIDPSRLRSAQQSVRDAVRFFEGLLDEGIKAGEFKVEDPCLVAFNIWVLMVEWGLRGWLLRGILTIDEYAQRQAEAIIRQVTVDKV